MRSTREELFQGLRAIEGAKVLVVGDIILDRYIWGRVERISPEAPVPVVDVNEIEDRLGGAGNVVRNLTGLGIKVSLAGFIGDDDDGRKVLSLLDDGHTNRDAVIVDRSRVTALKTRVVANSQQVCRVDREDRSVAPVALQEALAAAVDSQIADVDAVIVSDYAKGTVSEILLNRFKEAFDEKRLGLGIRPLIIDPKPANFNLYKCGTIIKPNKKEAEEAVGRKIKTPTDAFEVAQELKQRWGSEMLLVTLGEGGLVLVDKNGVSHHVETVAKEVYDVSGAGDTVTAVISAALAKGCSPVLAAELSNIAAGIVVSEVGTVAIDLKRMVEGIHSLFTKSAEQ
jgi:D-beta-D-heptose 7-phosphate kinase/D-beta-D-heptose 1-phosphate adenosyltransferase